MGADNDAINLDEHRQKKRRSGQAPPPIQGDDQRPFIRINAGELSEIVDQAEAALIQLDDGLYKQGLRIVRVIWDKIKTAGGADGDILRLSQVTAPHLVERFTAAAHWRKYSQSLEVDVACNCPPAIADMYIARDGVWNLPFILGVITTPTIRSDGTILDQPGYDTKTGILFNPQNVRFPAIPENPTKEDAMAALALLKEPLVGFPFSKPVGLSVALSGIMTTVIRRSLPTAPMHGFSSPTAGSGKSLLVDIASVIATGERASVTSTGHDKFGDTELEKRLSASMLAGDAVISIDNLEAPLGGELLCQLLTQTLAKIRVLGKSINIEVPVTTSFFATGNNLTVVGDLTRRVLIGTLDVPEERPELRHFKFHPVTQARANRGELVRAVLTIIRAYIISGDNVGITPLGSFEEWSRMIREPLIWLGESDPVDVLEEVRRGDPRLMRLRQMMDAWGKVFGEEPKRVRDVIKSGIALAPDEHGGGTEFVNPDLREALLAVMNSDKFINTEKFAWWLRKNAGRYVGKMRFEKVDEGNQLAQWRLAGWQGPVETGGVVQGKFDDDIPF